MDKENLSNNGEVEPELDKKELSAEKIEKKLKEEHVNF